MIQVKIHKNHKQNKIALVAGMEARMLIGFTLTAISGGLIYLFVPSDSQDLKEWLLFFVGTLFLPIGFVEFHGMPYEIALKEFILFKLNTNIVRTYKAESVYERLRHDLFLAESNEMSAKYKNVSKMKEEASVEKLTLYFNDINTLEFENDIDSPELSLDSYEDNLLTVSKFRKKVKVKAKSKDVSEVDKANKLKMKVDELHAKQLQNPNYVFTKSEYKIIADYHKSKEIEKLNLVNKNKKPIFTLINELNKRRKAKSQLPTSTQESIPYVADFDDGMFEVSPKRYSKTFLLKDVNYRDAKDEEQIEMFLSYGSFLNHFTSDTNLKITLDNKIVSRSLLEKQVLYPHQNDDLDVIRDEYNGIIKKRMQEGKNDKQLSKYITITMGAQNPLEASIRFQSIESDIKKNLRKIGSNASLQSTEEKLSYLHDKFRKGREGNLKIDFEFLKTQGLSSKDYIAPSFFYFPNTVKTDDLFMIENHYYRCYSVINLPSTLSDTFLYDITNFEFEIMATVDSKPMPQVKAHKSVKNSLTALNATIIQAQKRASKAGYDPDLIDPDLAENRNETQELLSSLKDQKMFITTILVMIGADSKNSLENNCKQFLSAVESHSVQAVSMTMQQEEAFKTVLPIGYESAKIKTARGLSTENLSIFMPFESEDLFQPGGMYYGLHQIKRTLIICARRLMKSPSGFILGKSGSGKSFAAKREMINIVLHDPQANLNVIDPEDEFGDFGLVFGAERIDISSSSDHHINALDMSENYGLSERDNPFKLSMAKKKEKALKKKSEYIHSLADVMLKGDLDLSEKGVLDKAIAKVYKTFLENDFNPEFVPTLFDLQDIIDELGKTDPVAMKLSKKTYYYFRGSLSIFSHKTNINTGKRFRIYVTKNLGSELSETASMVILDSIWNQTVKNLTLRERTYAYVDEIHRFFKSILASEYIEQYYKRGRKYGLITTGITQNATDLIKSDIAINMLSNSDFILMLDQSHTDLNILAEKLNLSTTQRGYLTRSNEGAGLLFAEKVIIPIEDNFPQSSYLYTLITTKFDDEKNIEEVQSYIQELIEESKKNREMDDVA